ncbi:MAG: HD domain-containing phosphohydrolase [Armatimonadota bacterium]|nr:HD domain-containing phosphohydrolase [Armatimonadota bacterium]MDR5696250.1 HD domain-containing phosphohydrolase [Armatimonadota bacterium]
MGRSLPGGLRGWLTAVILIAVVPLAALLLFEAGGRYRHNTEQARRQTLQVARFAALDLERVVVSAAHSLAALAQVGVVRNRSDAACNRWLAAAITADPRYANLGVAERDGRVSCSALPLRRPVNVADRRYFREAVRTGRFAIGEYQIGRITGKPTLNVALPLRDAAGGVQAVLFAALDLARLQEVAARAALPAGSVILVIDANGTILVRHPDPEGLTGRTLRDGHLLAAAGANSAELAGPDGVVRVYGFERLPGGPQEAAFVAVGIPRDPLLAQLRRDLAGRLGVAVAVVLAALLAAWTLADRFILRGVNRLIAAADRLASGESAARTDLRHDAGEIGRVAAALDRMAEAVEQREAALRRERQRVARQVEQLAALRQIDLAIIETHDLATTLDTVADQVTSLLSVDATDILLLHQATQTLRYAAGKGFRPDEGQRPAVRLSEGVSGRPVMESHTVLVPDLASLPDPMRPHPIGAERFVTYIGVPLIARGQVRGVLEVFHRRPLQPDADWMAFLETLAGQTAIAIDNAVLFSDLQRSHQELALAYDSTLEGWSRALDLRDEQTEGHTLRVTNQVLELARAVGIPQAELVHVRRGALLHDIGKIGIPDSILRKPGPLTEAEWEVMRRHPVYAYELLSPIEFLRPALDIPYCHHEKWDGTGYPRGLRGEQIPLAARVFAVIDVYDALTSDRPYRAAWPEDKAVAYIREQAGKHFDPAVVEAFLRMREGHREMKRALPA